MADDSHIEQFKKGPTPWNLWRASGQNLRPNLRDFEFLPVINEIHGSFYPPPIQDYDLSRVDLHGASFRNYMFENCRFDNSDINFADLVDAYFQDCSFDGVSVRVSKLGSAKFYSCSLRGADLSYCSAEETEFIASDFTGASLENMSLVRTTFDESSLVQARVYGISAWDLSLSRTKQQDIAITPAEDATISLDNAELAQFIYLLLNNQQLRDVIDTLTSKVVLILGRFTPRRKSILDTIKAALREVTWSLWSPTLRNHRRATYARL